MKQLLSSLVETNIQNVKHGDNVILRTHLGTGIGVSSIAFCGASQTSHRDPRRLTNTGIPTCLKLLKISFTNLLEPVQRHSKGHRNKHLQTKGREINFFAVAWEANKLLEFPSAFIRLVWFLE